MSEGDDVAIQPVSVGLGIPSARVYKAKRTNEFIFTIIKPKLPIEKSSFLT